MALEYINGFSYIGSFISSDNSSPKYVCKQTYKSWGCLKLSWEELQLKREREAGQNLPREDSDGRSEKDEFLVKWSTGSITT